MDHGILGKLNNEKMTLFNLVVLGDCICVWSYNDALSLPSNSRNYSFFGL